MESIKIKRIDHPYSRNKDMKQLLSYIIRDKNGNIVSYWDTRGTLRNEELAFKQIVAVQKILGKNTGRRLNHVVVSFPETERNIMAVQVVADEIADHFGRQYQLVYGVHTDTENYHIHFAISTVSFINGEKWHVNFWEFDKWIKEINEVAQKALIIYEDIIEMYALEQQQEN